MKSLLSRLGWSKKKKILNEENPIPVQQILFWIFKILLKRAPDPAAQEFYSTQIRNSVTVGLQAVLRQIYSSDEFFVKFILNTPRLKEHKHKLGLTIPYKKERIVYIHIPKAAGTTFYWEVLKKVFADKKLSDPLGGSHYLFMYPLIEVYSWDIVSGHIDVETVQHVYGPYTESLRFFTIVREPLDRLKSFVKYVYTTDHTVNYPLNDWWVDPQASLHEFFTQYEVLHLYTWNFMALQVMGVYTFQRLKQEYLRLKAQEKEEFIDKRVKPVITERLGTFEMVGLTEDFARTLRLFQKVFKVKVTAPPQRRNVSAQNTQQWGFRDVKVPEFTPDILQFLEDYIAWDRIVYEEAKKRFKELCKQYQV